MKCRFQVISCRLGVIRRRPAHPVPLVLDGATCDGLPSTVVDCTGQVPRLLREGRVAWEEVRVAFRG